MTVALSVEEAFYAYEAVRHRLPDAARPGGACRDVATLADIAPAFDAFLLDAFGVLNIGETAIPGVAERVADLQQAGKRVLVVSNAAGVPHRDTIEKYARLGFEFAPSDIITSRSTLIAALHGAESRRWGLMASRGTGFGDLAGLDVRYLEDDPAAYAEVEGFLLVGSWGWTEARQSLLEEALLADPRPVYVGNPDIVAPREDGFSREPGHFAHRLADRTGIAPRFYGKPFGDIYDLALARLGPDIARDRIVMVGDSLHTDILGAQAAGLRAALIADYGFFSGYRIADAIGQAGIRPDYIVARP
ncbi:MAG: HAD hydrolase-like protein [Pseudomonadota bacterium]